jgi:AcrR family transcriptional regulator
MPRAGLNRDAVIAHALEVLDASGARGLTLKAVADRAGVAAPSLYKHIRSLTDLRALMAVRVLDETARRTGAAVMGRAGEEAVDAFLAEYRALVVSHPHRHELVEGFPVGDPEVDRAAARVLRVLFAVLRGFGLGGDDLVHAARVLRAAVAGFAALEAGNGYQNPADVDLSFAFLCRTLAVGLRAAAPAPKAWPGCAV